MSDDIIKNILQDFDELLPLRTICKRNKIGERRLKNILNENGRDIKSRRGVKSVLYDEYKNKKYGHLTILDYHYNADISQYVMDIRCDCGNISWETLYKLKKGKRKTCGNHGCEYFHTLRSENAKYTFTGHKEIYGPRS